MAADLLPCPFCGGEAKIDAGMARDCTGKPPTHAMIPYAFARCTGCGIDYGNTGGQDLDAATREVVDHWNRRVPPLTAPAPSAMATGDAAVCARCGSSVACDACFTPYVIPPRATPPAAPAAVTITREHGLRFMLMWATGEPEDYTEEQIEDARRCIAFALAAAASAERGASGSKP